MSEEEKKIYQFLTPEERAKLQNELHTNKKSLGYDPELLKAEKRAEKVRAQDAEKRKKEEEKRKIREDRIRKEEEDKKRKADMKAEQERIRQIEKESARKPKAVYVPKTLAEMSEKEKQFVLSLTEEERIKLGINLDGTSITSSNSNQGSDEGKNLSRKASRRDTKESMYYDEELERKSSVAKYRRPSVFETGSYKQEVSPLLKSSSSPVVAEGSPIHEAARLGNKEQLRSFVKEGISINLLDGDGQVR